MYHILTLINNSALPFDTLENHIMSVRKSQVEYTHWLN